MFIIFLIVTFSCMVFSYKYEKNIYNPAFLLTAFWGVLGILSGLSLYGMYMPSNKTYFVCSLGVIFFSLGNLFSKQYIGNKQLVFSFNYRKISRYVFRKYCYKILVVCMLCYNGYRMLTVLEMWKAGYSLNMIRLVYFGVEVGGYQISRIVSIIETFIHLPALYACMAITSYNLALPNKKKFIDIPTVMLNVLWIVMAQIISGGRMTIYIFTVEIVISYIIVHSISAEKIKKIVSKYLKILCIIICAIGFIYILSLGRQKTASYNVFRSLYVDFCGCFTHMSLQFEKINFAPYTWGVSLLSGLLRPLMLIVKYTMGSFPEIYKRTVDIGAQLQPPIMIGDTIEFNAYVLPVFYFYYDAAYMGVIIDSFICGIVCYRIYSLVNCNDKTAISVSFYLMIIYAIFTSMVRYAGNLVYYVLAFFVIRVLFKKYYIQV